MKLSIYVPDDLKDQMNACDVNWSAIAQAAFRKHREKAQEFMMRVIKQHEEPCDCADCIAGRAARSN